ncbi:hypothetical protein [Xenorhabdus bovienii]|uniref:hypothetical protein n=1 Tax=Xenorhabdus bovienii TaxID=40576 RepID=UPI0023B2DAE4|nr:hypothetical protein [Xenorhabdus bovienii]
MRLNLGLAETKNQAQNALPRSGGEVTGDITISTDSEISWRRNTDMAAIGFKNTGDGDTDSYMWFKTADNGNEYFKWQHSLSGGGTNEWMSLKSDNLRVKGHQVYHEGYKPTAAIVGAYTKSEAESKYQPKGNYAVRGENYTKQESDGKYQPRGNYQPIGNYTLRGDCYTKGESDSRYLSFQNRSPRTVLSGVSLNDGETANLGVDCRGKVMWVWCTEPEYSAVMTVIPIDNYGVSTHYGYQGSIDLTLINGGRTIKVIYTRKDTRLWRIDIWD